MRRIVKPTSAVFKGNRMPTQEQMGGQIPPELEQMFKGMKQPFGTQTLEKDGVQQTRIQVTNICDTPVKVKVQEQEVELQPYQNQVMQWFTDEESPGHGMDMSFEPVIVIEGECKEVEGDQEEEAGPKQKEIIEYPY